MSRRRLVAGNWKMNGSRSMTETLLSELISGTSSSFGTDILICPSFPYLDQAAAALAGSSISLGAQDVSRGESGAFTGQVSAAMLVDLGCEYVLVGHSECRQFFHDTDLIVADKFYQAKKLGLKPVLCVGETKSQRESGQTEQVLASQIQAILAREGADAFTAAVIAYEPVWAIGTGLTATPTQAQQAHQFIRSIVAEKNANIASQLQILYGGSMKPENAATLFALPDVDGGLIGGASLSARDFLSICDSAKVA